MPEFDTEEFFEGWDVENQDIIIGDQAPDDVDNDWILNEEEIETEIKNFWSARVDSWNIFIIHIVQ